MRDKRLWRVELRHDGKHWCTVDQHGDYTAYATAAEANTAVDEAVTRYGDSRQEQEQ